MILNSDMYYLMEFQHQSPYISLLYKSPDNGHVKLLNDLIGHTYICTSLDEVFYYFMREVSMEDFCRHAADFYKNEIFNNKLEDVPVQSTVF